jgi:hypothetical protein
MSYQQLPHHRAEAGPPGWYSDPNGLQVLRWWDGRQWGHKTQPLPGLSQESEFPYRGVAPSDMDGLGRPEGAGRHWQESRLRDGAAPSGTASSPSAATLWAWAVASSPLLLLGVAAGLKAGVSHGLLMGAVAAAAFAVFAASRDARALRAAGEPVRPSLAWWCLLLPWVYLWARAVRRVHKSYADWALLTAAVAVWLLVIVFSVPVAGRATTGGETFNRVQAQAVIARGIKAQLGVAVMVDCPEEPPLNPGSQFQCVATEADGSATTITVEDQGGDVTWQTGG